MRRVLPILAIGLGLTMLLAGGYAVYMTWNDAVANLPGSQANGLRDQGLVALMGAGLIVAGLLRLALNRPRDE